MHFQKPPLGTPLDWGNPLNKDLALHLAMNEGHGDKVQDLSMNGNHGTLKNMAFPPTAASGWNPGQTGVGLNFDSTDDYIDCGNDASLNLQKSDFTISNWIMTDLSTAALQMTVTKYDGGNVGWFLCVRDFGFVNFKYGSGVAPREIYSPTACISVGNWYHVVFTHNATKDIIYVDGVNIKEQVSFNENVNTTADLLVGKYSTYLLKGSIDQVRVQNRAWTAKEARDYAINPWQVYLDE